MAKRTDTKIAVLVQVMAEMGFDQETIAKVTGVPQRTASDIANWRGYWRATGEFNEVRELYRHCLRKRIQDEAAALAHLFLKRFEEIAKDADVLTTFRIADALTTLAAKFNDGR